MAFSGWALRRAIALDHDCPGLLAASFGLGDQRRQAMFLVLAFVEILGIDEVGDHLGSAEGMREFTGTTHRSPSSAKPFFVSAAHAI